MISKLKVLLGESSLVKDQHGFTLVELLIVILIVAGVAAGVTAAIVGANNSSARSSNHNTAVREVQNVGLWLSQDVQMAERIAPSASSSGFPLILRWDNWPADNTTSQVTYRIVDVIGGIGKLQREYSGDSTILAQHVAVNPTADWEQTNVTVDGDVYTGYFVTLDITAVVGTGQRLVSENRIYEIKPRPGRY